MSQLSCHKRAVAGHADLIRCLLVGKRKDSRIVIIQ